MEPIGADVRRELGRFGPAAGMADLVAAWPGAVGLEIARNAWPARLARDGSLHVHTRDSVWAFELTQRADEIAARLGDLAPKRLRFAAGPLVDPPEPTAGAAAPAVPAATPEQVEQAADWAAEIDDADLRELVARAARASLARAMSGRRV